MSFLKTTADVVTFLVFALIAILECIAKIFIPAKYKMKNIVGDVALVTGGGGGLGRLLSLRLANIGAIVVVWDINKAGIDETVKLVQAAGGTCYGYVCDLCDREDVYKKAAIIKEEVGKVSILINNAGVVSALNFLDTPDKLVVRTMDVNVMSHFWTIKAFLPAMLETKKGHIVSIASLAGHTGVPQLVDYCASKSAAVGLMEALNIELESLGHTDIQTTLVCPYFIRSTGMFEGVISRFVPVLSPNVVADRIVSAMRCNEKVAIVPRYLRAFIIVKWLFPWTCVSMFMRSLIRIPQLPAAPESNSPVETVLPSIIAKEQNGANIHHQLTRRISSSERKP